MNFPKQSRRNNELFKESNALTLKGTFTTLLNILRRPGGHSSTSKVLVEETFTRMLYVEHKRSERSNRRFMLMLLYLSNSERENSYNRALDNVLHALPDVMRDTDIIGWYKTGSVIGVLFTELGAADASAIETALLAKVGKLLHGALDTQQQVDEVRLLFQVFPEVGDCKIEDESIGSTFNRSLVQSE